MTNLSVLYRIPYIAFCTCLVGDVLCEGEEGKVYWRREIQTAVVAPHTWRQKKSNGGVDWDGISV